MAQTMRVQPFSSSVRPAAFAMSRPRRTLVISASYKNKENIDLSRVPAYGRHEKDTGSSEIQIARLSARIDQISDHLKMNRKDFAAKRGLVALLSQRKTLLQYLYRENRDMYDKLCTDFNIRGVVTSDTRGASRRQEDALSTATAAST